MVGLISPESITFIDKFGFPVFVSTIVLTMIGLMVKRDAARQDKIEFRFDALVNKLFESITILTNKNETIAKETNTELRSIAVELKSITTKIDTYTDIVKEDLKSKTRAIVFKSEDDIRDHESNKQ